MALTHIETRATCPCQGLSTGKPGVFCLSHDREELLPRVGQAWSRADRPEAAAAAEAAEVLHSRRPQEETRAGLFPGSRRNRVGLLFFRLRSAVRVRTPQGDPCP